MKKILVIIVILTFNINALAQNYSKGDVNSKPKNLTEAVDILQKIHNDSIKNSITKLSEMEFLKKYYMSLGFQIRNQWKLWKKKSEIVRYFNSLGIYNPDDMSGIILMSYYRELKKEDWKLDEQLRFFKKE